VSVGSTPSGALRARARPAEIASVLAVPALFGALETAQLLARTAGAPDAPGLGEALVYTIPRWLLYAPLAFAVGEIVRRVPLGSRPTSRAVAIHSGAALAFAVLHLAACVIVYGFLLDGAPNRVSVRFSYLLTMDLAADLLAYAAVASLWSASHHARASRERHDSAARYRASFERARLDALRAQLQPHFLFNSLNAIHVLAKRGDASSAAAMTASLAELLRSTLDESLSHEIPLGRELKILESYLDVQRARFGDRVRILVDAEFQAAGALLPALALQPLVENAFEHGISTGPGPCTIRITARRLGDSLRVEIEDEGPGFPARAKEGVGLANTRERLRLLYGDGAALETGHSATGGGLVTLVVPFLGTEGSA